MTAGRKPQPTALKLVRGNPGRRPLNKNEPRVEAALPPAPEHLSAEACAEWDRVCGKLVAAGIMTEIDAAVLATYCQAYGRWIQAENAIRMMAEREGMMRGLLMKSAKGNVIANPLVSVANVAMRDVVRYASELGMMPSARSRIKATDAVSESDNPFFVLKHG